MIENLVYIFSVGSLITLWWKMFLKAYYGSDKDG